MEENNANRENPPESDSAESAGSFDLNAVIADARKVITDPRGFYRGMRTSGGYSEPLIFVVVMAVATALVTAVMGFLGFGMGGAAAGLAALIVVPIVLGIFSFVGAAVMFLVWKLMGSGRNYQTAYRCVAYSCAVLPVVAVANFVPYLGGILSGAWGAYLMAMASIEVHGRKRETAYAVFAVLGLILVLANVSRERQARRFQAQAEEFGDPFEGVEDMTPEEAGRALGEFLQGFEEAANEANGDEN